MIQGTPAFIAPEQALGGADVDARADIYSTGCVAYWLLTGQLVFTADTAMKTLLAHAHAAAGTTLVENPGSDSTGPGCTGPVLPRQRSRTPATVCPPSPSAARRDCTPATLDRRARPGVVEHASPRVAVARLLAFTSQVKRREIRANDCPLHAPVLARRRLRCRRCERS